MKGVLALTDLPADPDIAVEPQENPENQKLQNIKELGQIEIPSFKTDIHCLTIAGQVEGHMVLPPAKQNNSL
jgi:hypothetical protein